MFQWKLSFALIALVGATLQVRAQESEASRESIIVVEAYSGKVLVAANATEKRPIASLTKIATGAVAVDWATATGADIASLRINVPDTITLVGGPNPMNLQPGDQITLRDALYAALLGSDNLAAFTIADHVGRQLLSRRGKSGDPVGEFVGEMNRLTKALAMTQTRFANPHGLERPGIKAFSSAADVARLSIHAMRRNAFSFIVRQKERQITVYGSSGSRGYSIRNSNDLVGEQGILGVKTGTTSAAGPCVSVCMERDPMVRIKPDGTKGATPRRLIVVVLNNPDRFSRARSLISQGWAIYDPWLAAGAPVKDRRRELISVPDPG
jgi:D-alanyl-D-alanine carboxypeptidase (penicillin-binding protein 5/6)